MKIPITAGGGGRYVNMKDNTWLGPVPTGGYEYPEGRWYTKSAWGRMYMRETYPKKAEEMAAYFKPITRWTDALQKDFAARADWCVQSYKEANHAPSVKLNHSNKLDAAAGETLQLSAEGTTDPDGDELTYNWTSSPTTGGTTKNRAALTEMSGLKMPIPNRL